MKEIIAEETTKKLSKLLYDNYLVNIDKHPETRERMNNISISDAKDIVEFIIDKLSVNMSFEETSNFLLKWQNENTHPHTIIVLNGTNAQLFEGVKSHINDIYIVD
jgi:hypothetical protein